MTREAELASILEEMDAQADWARLDRESQLSWLHWIEHSGELPRVRMYETINHLRAGRTRPPSFSKLRAWLGALLSGPSWW